MFTTSLIKKLSSNFPAVLHRSCFPGDGKNSSPPPHTGGVWGYPRTEAANLPFFRWYIQPGVKLKATIEMAGPPIEQGGLLLRKQLMGQLLWLS